MSANKVLLILGAGRNIGQAVAAAAVSKGYKVALVARSVDKAHDNDNQINLSADLSTPDTVVDVFSKVKSRFGVPPSVVIHNASNAKFGTEDDPLQVSASDMMTAFNVNTFSAYIAAQEAVKGFAELPSSASRTFIYTGNFLNTKTVPRLISLGASKTAAAHFIEAAATAYADKGYKFYYADERKADGDGMWKGTGANAAAVYYLQLAESEKHGPWLQTFVEGSGYKDFATAKV